MPGCTCMLQARAAFLDSLASRSGNILTCNVQQLLQSGLPGVLLHKRDLAQDEFDMAPCKPHSAVHATLCL